VVLQRRNSVARPPAGNSLCASYSSFIIRSNAPDYGQTLTRNMSSQFEFINKPLLLHLVGFLLYHRYVNHLVQHYFTKLSLWAALCQAYGIRCNRLPKLCPLICLRFFVSCFFFVAQQPYSDLGHLIVGVTIKDTLSTTPLEEETDRRR
jgi:hypothetical protein